MYYVYILKSESDNKVYVGFTKHLKRRLKEHNTGLVKSTKSRRPFKLIYKELAENSKEAREKEKFFKSGTGRDYLRKVINIVKTASRRLRQI